MTNNKTRQHSKLNTTKRFPVVGIGASAGGFDALRRFLEAMPDDPDVAIIIVQHLARDKPSLAPELLSKYTAMEVQQVHNEPVVRRNCVYIIPPGKYLSIAGGQLHLSPIEGPRGAPIAIDCFFLALARDQRECAVGIILSGTGSDGTLGIKAIKEAGGFVIAQDTSTAEHTEMPSSAIESGMVDQILAPEQIPQALIQYAEHSYICNEAPVRSDAGAEAKSSDPELSSDSLEAIIALLLSHGNRDFRNYKHATLMRLTLRRMCLQHMDRVEDYIELLQHHPEAAQNLVRVKVTDHGRSLGDFSNDFPDDTLHEECERVLKRLIPIENEIACSNNRTFIRRVVPYRTDDLRIGGGVITMIDITLRKRLQHVTRVANESRTVDDAMMATLKQIATYNDWLVGHLWRADDHSGEMQSSGLWYVRDEKHATIKQFEEFRERLSQRQVSADQGLAGMVIRSGEPQWVDDTAGRLEGAEFSELGLHATIAFPITIMGEVVAVMEFWSDKEGVPQSELLEIIPDVGIQLGHIIARKRGDRLASEITLAEQRRIGRELHDGIPQQLTGGAMIAESLKRNLPLNLSLQHESLDHLREILKQTHRDVRQLACGLIPGELEASDLLPSLRGLAAETSARCPVRGG